MLLIWDVHINWINCDNIISNVRDYILSNNDINVVFMWDFVYHFSYDRKSLLKVFSLFVELFELWKNIYVLAWNHDRISDNFVFYEWQKTFDIINEKFPNFIKFITEPKLEEIDWKEILFLPYNYNISSTYDVNDEISFDEKSSIDILIKDLYSSDDKLERLSWQVNNFLYFYLKKKPNLIVIHHYYFANTVFTWQKSRFSYKDVAISDLFLKEYPNVKFISWHLHQWFVFNNYFCTWSIWNTSFLEQNQFKFLYKYDPVNSEIVWTPIIINPYIYIDLSNYELVENKLYDKISKNEICFDEVFLEKKIKEIYDANLANFKSEKYNFIFDDLKLDDYKKLTLTLYWSFLDYDNIWNIVNDDINMKIKELKVKKQKLSVDSVLDMTDWLNKDLQNSISDWKSLLLDYLSKKFPQEKDEYEKILRNLKVI